MKKVLSLLVIAVMLLGLAACGPINGAKQVAILWSGDGTVKIPNSLINAMERAMYIENIAYAHFGAKQNATSQVEQAKKALDGGCVALAVEAVDSDAAAQIVDLAKAKNTPVVFFNSPVADAIIQSYANCYVVDTDTTSLGSVQGKLIKEYVEGVVSDEKQMKNIDRNGDGKISYIIIGDVKDTLKYVSTSMTAALPDQAVLTDVDVDAKMTYLLANFTDEKKNMVEMYITGSDEVALTVLKHLQEAGYNSDRLTTHNIPVFTIGSDADARAFADTSTMKPEDVEKLIFTCTNVVDAGKMTGITLADEDAIAESTAAILRNLIQGKAAMDGIKNPTGKQKLLIPYTTYKK